MIKKPMSSSHVKDEEIIFPIYASPKMDGIRALIHNGKALSKSLKPIRNDYIQEWVHDHQYYLEGFDGELIVGNPTDIDVYRNTISGVMSKDGQPNFSYYVFDYWNRGFIDYKTAWISNNRGPFENERLIITDTKMILSLEQLLEYEIQILTEGYEGLMLRSLYSPYKEGRSSVNEGYLLKLKRFYDAEAIIIGYKEEMHNDNEAIINEVGNSHRSSHKDNKIGKNCLGSFICNGIETFTDQEFDIGAGIKAEERLLYWQIRDEMIGKIIKYKYFSIGVKDKPRHPVFLGLRDKRDM